MIFWILHNILNNLTTIKDWSESKKNLTNLLVGGNIYILLYVTLGYLVKKSDNFLLEGFYNFFIYFVILDVMAMAIIYKLYWGRPITTEIGSSILKQDDNSINSIDNINTNFESNLNINRERNSKLENYSTRNVNIYDDDNSDNSISNSDNSISNSDNNNDNNNNNDSIKISNNDID